MNRRYSIAALGIGLLSGALAFLLLHQKAVEIRSQTTPLEILVASRYIPTGTLLKEDMIVKKSIPKAFISPSAILDLREVEGFQSLVPLSAGEQILSNKFGFGDASLSAFLPSGKRAYTLEVNEPSGVGGLLKPGDHIDILGKFAAGGRELTSFLFQNILVLATGRKLGGIRSSREGDVPTDRGDYGNVTLSVTPEEAEALMFLEGRPLRLVLRALGDEEFISLGPQSESDVLSRLGHFTPRTSGKSIEIIRRHPGEGASE